MAKGKKEKGNISRKDFFTSFFQFSFSRNTWRGAILPAFFLLTGVIFHLSNKTHQKTGTAGKSVELPDESILDGLNIYPEFLASRQDGKTIFLSNRCTHLGCKIQKKDKDHFICHCHGSHFDAWGRVARGPADSPLPRLHSEKIRTNGQSIYKIDIHETS